MDSLETRNFTFSIEKILLRKVFLHVKSEDDLYSVFLRFDGRFENPIKISSKEFKMIESSIGMDDADSVEKYNPVTLI